jgi:tRNA/tmRNA/rRNA uracil-C5-methylase (TrmA/RlmC/RlmD family)
MINYEKQLQIKQQLVEDSFKKITKENPIRFLPILSSPLQRGYRNKIEFSF